VEPPPSGGGFFAGHRLPVWCVTRPGPDLSSAVTKEGSNAGGFWESEEGKGFAEKLTMSEDAFVAEQGQIGTDFPTLREGSVALSFPWNVCVNNMAIRHYQAVRREDEPRSGTPTSASSLPDVNLDDCSAHALYRPRHGGRVGVEQGIIIDRRRMLLVVLGRIPLG
jgi:hypothetical protein